MAEKFNNYQSSYVAHRLPPIKKLMAHNCPEQLKQLQEGKMIDIVHTRPHYVGDYTMPWPLFSERIPVAGRLQPAAPSKDAKKQQSLGLNFAAIEEEKEVPERAMAVKLIAHSSSDNQSSDANESG